jgi:NTE family protein
MIGLALSGGGSRAMAFHLGCLRALNDVGLLEQVKVLSTISGGSVIGAYYAYAPARSFTEFEADIRGFLRRGFQRSILRELFKLSNFAGILANFASTRIAETVTLVTKKETGVRRVFSRTDLFRHVLNRDVFAGAGLRSARRNGMEVVIGACELRYGTAFRFGNEISGDWRRGTLVENDLDVALAVAASAAYPIFLPALDRTWSFRKGGVETQHRVCLADGGIYDNLGIQVLEPNRDATVSLHHFPCEYLIACNAGHGQAVGHEIPLGFYRRVRRSFGIVHRRVQDSLMNRLHYLKSSGSIKGFILPYLGQLDDRLPWKPGTLVAREEVIGYPTDFAAMGEKWIDRLSSRGEQLTRCLLSQYLPELV